MKMVWEYNEFLTTVLLKTEIIWHVTLCPWVQFPVFWRHHDPSECEELFIQRHNVTSQDSRIFGLGEVMGTILLVMWWPVLCSGQ